MVSRQGHRHPWEEGFVWYSHAGTGNDPEMARVLALLCGSHLRLLGSWTGKGPSLPQVTWCVCAPGKQPRWPLFQRSGQEKLQRQCGLVFWPGGRTSPLWRPVFLLDHSRSCCETSKRMNGFEGWRLQHVPEQAVGGFISLLTLALSSPSPFAWPYPPASS